MYRTCGVQGCLFIELITTGVRFHDSKFLSNYRPQVTANRFRADMPMQITAGQSSPSYVTQFNNTKEHIQIL
jgi:hypothetical protein